MSRLHQVTGRSAGGIVEVADMDGAIHRVSLLALDGPEPEPGEWLVVHSGYAIGRVDAAEAEAIAAEIRGAPTTEPRILSSEGESVEADLPFQ